MLPSSSTDMEEVDVENLLRWEADGWRERRAWSWGSEERGVCVCVSTKSLDQYIHTKGHTRTSTTTHTHSPQPLRFLRPIHTHCPSPKHHHTHSRCHSAWLKNSYRPESRAVESGKRVSSYQTMPRALLTQWRADNQCLQYCI